MRRKGFAIGLTGLLVAGCSLYTSLESSQKLISGAVSPSEYVSGKSAVGYDLVNQAVFSNSCVSCHNSSVPSAGVALDSYSHVISNLAGVRSAALINQFMPPSGPLSDLQLTILRDWINAGAPQPMTVVTDTLPTPTPTPGMSTPTPTPSPTPMLSATYSSLRGQLIAPKCLTCHDSGGGGGGLALDTYARVYSNRDRMLNAMLSGRMPPSGRPRPTSAELSAFQLWVNAGAPEN